MNTQQPNPSLKHYAKLALSLMDLTSLNDDDTDEKIIELCQKANSQFGQTSAVCVYPQFIQTAKQTLTEQNTPQVKVATVTNFPHGHADIAKAVAETKSAVANGADEVDVVFPYRAFIDGDEKVGAELVAQCKQVCQQHNVLLKVIIETGELKTAELINKASNIAIANGADFIKTSTGKVAVNATLASAKIMLQAIKDSGKQVGFKAAGGVRTAEDAMQYLQLAEEMMGKNWLSSSTFRFGASGLLASLLATLNDEMNEDVSTATASY